MPFNYSQITYPEVEMLPELVPLCKLIDQEIGWYPNNCLMNFYPDGQSTMGYHSDSMEELKPDTGVVVISLGAERVISFRNNLTEEIHRYEFKNGMLLYMSAEIQDDWCHGVRKQEGAGERISLTFRCVVEDVPEPVEQLPEPVEQSPEPIEQSPPRRSLWKSFFEGRLTPRLGKLMCSECGAPYSPDNMNICSSCGTNYCYECVWKLKKVETGYSHKWMCYCGGELRLGD